MKTWTYKGIDVFSAERNSSGIRWYARTGAGVVLRSDTKSGMRQLITEAKAREKRIGLVSRVK